MILLYSSKLSLDCIFESLSKLFRHILSNSSWSSLYQTTWIALESGQKSYSRVCLNSVTMKVLTLHVLPSTQLTWIALESWQKSYLIYSRVCLNSVTMKVLTLHVLPSTQLTSIALESGLYL